MGVLVHQVASVYPLEVQLAQTVAAGQPVGVTLDNINDMHAMHAKMYGSVTKEAASICSGATAPLRRPPSAR